MPKDTPLILVHGLRGDRHGLLEIASHLEKMGYRCIVPDLPGSGDRAEIDDKNLDSYADWMHDFVCNQDFNAKPVIIGHSMGSIIVSHYAEKYPEDSNRKFILISPIFRGEFGQIVSDLEYAVMSGLLHLLPTSLRYNLMKSRAVSYCISHALTVDKTQQKRIDDLHYRYSGRFSSAKSLLADAKISMREQSIFPRKKHCLVCIGEKDRLTSARYAEARTKKQDDAIFKVLAESGHLVNYERPQTLAKLIDEFLQEK